MFSENDFTLDCQTCQAANTTACSDCIVSHLLANDDGPIDLEPVPVHAPVSPIDRAVGMFDRAGLLGETAEFVTQLEFDEGRLLHALT